MLNVLASRWSVAVRVDLSILKLKQGKLPICQSKSSGTDNSLCYIYYNHL